MSERCRDKQSGAEEPREVELRVFVSYGEPVHSQVLAWLPILLGLVAAASVACLLCPVPRSQTISAAQAFLVSAIYVLATAAAGAVALAVSNRIATSNGSKSVGRVIVPFCGTAAWMTPFVAFYTRESFWAVSTAAALGAILGTLIYGHHLEIRETETSSPSVDFRSLESFRTRRGQPMVLVALLLQVAAVCIVAGMARPASLLIGTAMFLIVWFRGEGFKQDRFRDQDGFSFAWRSIVAASLAVLLVTASLAPYLRAGRETGSSPVAATPYNPGEASEKNSLFKRARSMSAGAPGDSPRPRAGGIDVKAENGARAYPVLQALFGEGEPNSSSSKATPDMRLTTIVAGDSYRGMILRPKLKDHTILVPPSPRRRVFDGNPNERKMEPVSIPFYGAYWFFRAYDQTLPAGAIESRGDPASLSVQTTDYTPLSMEAHQNFGALIGLSCCQAIQVFITNGDRRPNTVSAELILVNTRLPGHPRQSLGSLPVNSTLRWYPGDNRPPVSEVLNFRMPAQSAIQSFDEAFIRFELHSPRRIWRREDGNRPVSFDPAWVVILQLRATRCACGVWKQRCWGKLFRAGQAAVPRSVPLNPTAGNRGLIGTKVLRTITSFLVWQDSDCVAVFFAAVDHEEIAVLTDKVSRYSLPVLRTEGWADIVTLQYRSIADIGFLNSLSGCSLNCALERSEPLGSDLIVPSNSALDEQGSECQGHRSGRYKNRQENPRYSSESYVRHR